MAVCLSEPLTYTINISPFSAHVIIHVNGTCITSFVPRPFEGKAWGLLRAHARKISFIFRIIRRKISDNDVIVHGESARKEYADTFVYTVQ